MTYQMVIHGTANYLIDLKILKQGKEEAIHTRIEGDL